MPANAADSLDEKAVARTVGAMRARLRLQHAIGAAAYAGIIAFALAGLFVTQQKLAHETLATLIAWATLLLPCVLVLAATVRRVSSLVAAHELDGSCGVPDLISSAWAFSQQPGTSRSVFARATIGQAADVCRSLVVSRAHPIAWPSVLWAWPLLALGVALVWRMPVSPVRSQPTHRSNASTQPVILDAIDVARARRLFETARAVAASDATVDQLARELEDLLARVATHRSNRLELLRGLLAVETRASAASLHTEEPLAELQGLGRAMLSHDVTRELGAALTRGDLTAARAALDKLAAAAAQPGAARELERLRAALRDAVSRQQLARAGRGSRGESRRTLDSLQRERESERSELSSGTSDRNDRRDALDRALRNERAERERKRQLDRLERERAADTGHTTQPSLRPRRDRERLERDLETAADGAGGRDSSRATTEALRSASEALERIDAASRRDRALARLQAQVAELKQRLAQPEPGRGSNGETTASADTPEQPKVLTPESLRGAGSSRSKASPSEQRSSEGESGVLVHGQGLSPEHSALAAQRMSEQPVPTDEGRPATGTATRSGSADVDVAVAGAIGKGPSRRSVIYDAAAEGFATLGYQKVHAEYAAHAEAELEREAIPAGYRLQVHRYFDLIQPHEDADE